MAENEVIAPATQPTPKPKAKKKAVKKKAATKKAPASRLNKKLGALMKKAVAASGLDNAAFAKQAGLNVPNLYNMKYGTVTRIQPNVALRVARLGKMNSKLFEPHLSERPPRGKARILRGTTKKKVTRSVKQTPNSFVDIIELPCPRCHGEGSIKVRQV